MVISYPILSNCQQMALQYNKTQEREREKEQDIYENEFMSLIPQEPLRISSMTIYRGNTMRRTQKDLIIIITADNVCNTMEIRINEKQCKSCNTPFSEMDMVCVHCMNVIPGRFVECSGKYNKKLSVRLTSDGEIQDNRISSSNSPSVFFKKLSESKLVVNHVTIGEECLFFSTRDGGIYGYSMVPDPLLVNGIKQIKKLCNNPIHVKKLVTIKGYLIVLTEPLYNGSFSGVDVNTQSNTPIYDSVNSNILYYKIPTNLENHDYMWLLEHIKKPGKLSIEYPKTVRGIDLQSSMSTLDIKEILEKERDIMSAIYSNVTFEECTAPKRDGASIIDIFSTRDRGTELLITYDDDKSFILCTPLTHAENSEDKMLVFRPIESKGDLPIEMTRIISVVQSTGYSNQLKYDFSVYYLLDNNGLLWNLYSDCDSEYELSQICNRKKPSHVSILNATRDNPYGSRICSISRYDYDVILLLEDGRLVRIESTESGNIINFIGNGSIIQNNRKNTKRALSCSYLTDISSPIDYKPHPKRIKTELYVAPNDPEINDVVNTTDN